MTAGARGKLVGRARIATGLDVVEVTRTNDGSVHFITADGRVGIWTIRTGYVGLLDFGQ